MALLQQNYELSRFEKTPSDGAWAGRTSMSRTLGPPGIRLYKCSWSSLNVDSIFADSLSCWELFMTPQISTSVTFLVHLWTCACKRVTKTMIHPTCLFSLQTDVLFTISSAAFCVKWGSPNFCQKILKYLTIQWSCYFRWLPGVVPKCIEAGACLREKMCVLDELCWTGCWPWINIVCEVRCLCTETHVKQSDVSVCPPLHSVTAVTRVFAEFSVGSTLQDVNITDTKNWLFTTWVCPS